MSARDFTDVEDFIQKDIISQLPRWSLYEKSIQDSEIYLAIHAHQKTGIVRLGFNTSSAQTTKSFVDENFEEHNKKRQIYLVVEQTDILDEADEDESIPTPKVESKKPRVKKELVQQPARVKHESDTRTKEPYSVQVKTELPQIKTELFPSRVKAEPSSVRAKKSLRKLQSRTNLVAENPFSHPQEIDQEQLPAPSYVASKRPLSYSSDDTSPSQTQLAVRSLSQPSIDPSAVPAASFDRTEDNSGFSSPINPLSTSPLTPNTTSRTEVSETSLPSIPTLFQKLREQRTLQHDTLGQDIQERSTRLDQPQPVRRSYRPRVPPKKP